MKILASDLDGTLYFGEQNPTVKAQDFTAIQEFQKEGNLFGICSGRTLFGLNNALNGTGVHLDFYILASGSAIADENEKYIIQHTLSRDLISRIVETLDSSLMTILFCHQNHYYSLGKKQQKGHAKNIKHVMDAPDYAYESLHLGFDEDGTIIRQYRKILLEKFSDEIEVHHNINNLDITPKNCSKGHAIKQLAELYNVDYDDVYVIGDSYNDISMLEATLNAFSFNRSPDEVKKHANYLVDDIAQAINIIKKNQ